MPEGTYAVVLTVPDELELRRLEDRLRRSGLSHAAVTENDAPYTGQMTAIGLRPMERRWLKEFLGKLPLLK